MAERAARRTTEVATDVPDPTGTAPRATVRAPAPAATAERAGRLRPGLPVLWRSLTEIQVGVDPRWAVGLTGLSPSAARALQATPPGADLRTLRAMLKREQVGAAEVEQVVDHLWRAGVLVAPGGPATSTDRTAWALLTADGRTPDVDARAHRRVRVCGLSRLGVVVAATLTSAGVGRIELDDDGLVTGHDTGVGGLTARDVGAPRTAAVARLLHDLRPGVRTGSPGRVTPDLVVLVERGAADPVRYRELLADGIPHLSVVLREASVLVGPLVEPGRTGCLRCVDLHRTGADERWPTLATQLALRAGRTDEVESTLAAVGGSVAAAQALAHVDGRTTTVDSAALEVRLPDAVPRRMDLPPHAGCGCLSLAPPEDD